MKSPLPSSNNLFRAAIVSSVVLHGAVFASSLQMGFFQPRYGVTKAPASVEVQLVEIQPEPKPVVKEEVLTAAPEVKTPATVKKEEPKPEPEPKIQESKPTPVIPQTGAVRKEAEAYEDNPAPVYPERARIRGWEGLVVLNVTVSAAGEASQVRLQTSSGHELLDEAAIKTVKSWRFKPAGIGKLTFDSTVRIPVRFKLTDR